MAPSFLFFPPIPTRKYRQVICDTPGCNRLAVTLPLYALAHVQTFSCHLMCMYSVSLLYFPSEIIVGNNGVSLEDLYRFVVAVMMLLVNMLYVCYDLAPP
jgi:hypothetical protein